MPRIKEPSEALEVESVVEDICYAISIHSVKRLDAANADLAKVAEELRLLREAEGWLRAVLLEATSSYCEYCRRPAPKDVDGCLIGPVQHSDGCLAESAEKTLAALDRLRAGREGA